MMENEWRDIPGYEGLYQVSSIGEVRGFKRGKWTPRKLTRTKKPKDRMTVGLWKDDGLKVRLVHRLVLMAFVGPCPDGMVACHKDGNPMNNAVGNLRWDTVQANHNDMIEHGTRARGSRHGVAKITEADVPGIRNSPLSHKELAAQFGVSRSLIEYVRLRKTWKHVP